MGRKYNAGFIYLIITILFFSSYEVVSKTLVGYIDPVQVNFIRFFFGGLILFPFAIQDLHKKRILPGITDLFHMALLGVLLVGVSMVLLQYGINQTRANLAALIFCSNPLFVALTIPWILGEKLKFKTVIWMLTGFAGVSITFLSNDNGEVLYRSGILFLLLSSLTYGVYTAFGKKLTMKMGSLVMNSFSFILGSISLIPILILKQLPLFTFNSSICLQIIYLTVFVTGIAYYCYFKGLSMVDTSLGSMIFFIKPVLASLLAFVILGENITSSLIIGTAIIIASIYMVRR